MTRARDLADLLTGGQTISTADNNPQLTLTSTDTDSGHGPRLNMVRNPSEAGADGDNLGQIFIQGYNDAGTPELIDYFQLFTEIADASDGTEDARQIHYVMTGGSQRSRIEHNATETVFNEDSVDVDFRVESNGNANMLVVDASADAVGIGTASPNELLHLNANNPEFTMQAATDGGECAIYFKDDDGNKDGRITYRTDYSGQTDNFMSFFTNGSERMRILSGGQVFIGKTAENIQSDGVEVHPGAHLSSTSSGAVAGIFNRKTNDGTLVQLRQDNTTEGSITVSGTTVTYGGGHLARWSRLSDNSKDTSIVKGTVMTNLDQMVVWHCEAQPATYYEEGDELPEGVSVGDEKTPAVSAYDEDNEQLNCTAVSSVEGDANVAGVFVSWDDEDDYNDFFVGMTGDMVIRIAQGTTVARGDLLMSAGDGTAKPQGDDIVRSKTIAKVTSTTKSHTYDDGSYLVPCVLMAC